MMKKLFLLTALLIVAQESYANKNLICVQNYTDLDFIITIHNNKKEIVTTLSSKSFNADPSIFTSIRFSDLEDDLYSIRISRENPSIFSYLWFTRNYRTLKKASDSVSDQTSSSVNGSVFWNEQLKDTQVLIKLISQAEQRHIVAEYQKKNLGCE